MLRKEARQNVADDASDSMGCKYLDKKFSFSLLCIRERQE